MRRPTLRAPSPLSRRNSTTWAFPFSHETSLTKLRISLDSTTLAQDWAWPLEVTTFPGPLEE
jgi:hypothetical protein